MSLRFLALALLATVHANSARQACSPCNPQGATGTNAPAVGSGLASLYTNVLASVKDIHFRKRQMKAVVAREDGFCCRQTVDCVKVQTQNIPMCYDKFTTQYTFPDGSFGSLTTGDYISGQLKANLISGEYTKEGGDKGDIYAEDAAAKPNTATMSIPPQWTAEGVGSAIPATELGSVVLITATMPGTTITAPTVLPESTVVNSVFTSIVNSAAVAAPSSSSSTGATGLGVRQAPASLGVSLFSGLMYAMYAWECGV
ncbi:hypothetical protein BDV95DRAFT_602512 [Massariosphaeria phaeospora]|uniref:Uncharacterized protein n=1 Tax=Massariosphaeria phaeospora TaxID=100035 RepID=A0A7C8IH86_9PLEO|nr:hypothetical protein BDV95DRAFT_602512 [Massariosphaeria phaeospora]